MSLAADRLPRPRVLVVDDEPAIRDALVRALVLEGFEALPAADGPGALSLLDAVPVDLMVLDVLMPGMDGLTVCRRVRQRNVDVGILVLTAKDAVADRVEGLEAGADDYVVKPFALAELVARLRALLRRTRVDQEERLAFDDLWLEPATYRAGRGDVPLELTRTEFTLLELFLRNPQRVLTRDLIYDRVWGYQFGASSNTLEVYVGYLRRKTEIADRPRVIHTVRGVGYVLRTS